MASLNFTINRQFNLYRNTKHKNKVNLKLQEFHYIRAHVINMMVVLTIFPVILQTGCLMGDLSWMITKKSD